MKPANEGVSIYRHTYWNNKPSDYHGRGEYNGVYVCFSQHDNSLYSSFSRTITYPAHLIGQEYVEEKRGLFLYPCIYDLCSIKLYINKINIQSMNLPYMSVIVL
jgi:hypothetical protein